LPQPKPLDRAAVAALVRGIRALAAGVSLDHRDPRRVLPTIDPRHLWRVLPRLFTGAADLAEDLDTIDPTGRDFMRHVATAIEGRVKAGVAPRKAVAR
jgi:hypothetical protein